MKSLLRAGLFALGLLIAQFAVSAPALAVCGVASGTCFVVAAGGNSNSTSTWSASSGGATCTCTPASTDAVILDSLAGHLTVNAALSAASLDESGTGGSGSPYTNTLTINSGQTFTITGNLFKLVVGATFVGTGNLTYTSTTGTLGSPTAITFVPSHNSMAGNLTFNGTAGVFELEDGFTGTLATSGITVTAGTLDLATNNPNVTTGAITANTASSTLNCGSGTWTIISASSNAAWLTINAAAVSCASATISFVNAAPTALRGFAPGSGQSFGTLNLSGSGSTSTNSWAVSIGAATGQSITIGTLNITAPLTVEAAGGTTVNVTNAPNWSGTPTAPIVLQTSNTTGTNNSVTFGLNGSPTLTGLLLGNVAFSGVGGLTASNSVGIGNYSGITLTAPASGGGGRIIGGFLMQRDLPANDNYLIIFKNKVA